MMIHTYKIKYMTCEISPFFHFSIILIKWEYYDREMIENWYLIYSFKYKFENLLIFSFIYCFYFSLENYSNFFVEYDTLITPVRPANPWQCEDPLLWEYEKPLVDRPSKSRVKRWAFSFDELLKDPTGVREFTKYCEADFSNESIMFYTACKEVHSLPNKSVDQHNLLIYR